jgi:hypothetical protein
MMNNNDRQIRSTAGAIALATKVNGRKSSSHSKQTYNKEAKID